MEPTAPLIEVGSTAWFVLMGLAGLAVGVAYAMWKRVREKD